MQRKTTQKCKTWKLAFGLTKIDPTVSSNVLTGRIALVAVVGYSRSLKPQFGGLTCWCCVDARLRVPLSPCSLGDFQIPLDSQQRRAAMRETFKIS